jgi:NADH-quinone oxidoreductase subunit F
MTLTSFGPANRIARAETHPLTWRLRDDGEPVWLDEYQAKNGYAARARPGRHGPDDIVQTVKDSGLKGRGGAGFPTGVKWGLMPKDESMNIRYLLCNADEMEPNTWKDRMLMEQLPHLLVEGMLISARALKAYRGYIFLRGEYTTRSTSTAPSKKPRPRACWARTSSAAASTSSCSCTPAPGATSAVKKPH